MSLCIACRLHETDKLQCDVCLAEPRTNASLLQEAVHGAARGDGAMLRNNAPSSHEQPRSVQQAPRTFHVTLPWTAMASDNRNVGITGRKGDRDAVKLAKARALEVLREAYGDRRKMTGNVRILFQFHMPDDRVRDPANMLKVLMDALKTVVLSDDRWQVARSGTWDVAGIDPDRPRCEVSIEPYAR